MFDVPDPLVVLLLTHEYIYYYICLPHSWHPLCDSLFISCAQNTQIVICVFDPPSLI